MAAKTLSVPEVAARLGVSTATVWRMVNLDHAFPGAFRVRTRGPWRIPLADVKAVERRQQATPAAS